MKKLKTEFGIRKWNFSKIETNQSSVLDIKIPDTFKLGKNRFTINVSPNKLLKGSDIYIDIIDLQGNVIYHEVSALVNDDSTRNIVVYVYSDTPIGNCKVYIAGTLKGTDTELINTANYVCIYDVYVNSAEVVGGELVFKNIPTVKYKERLQPIAFSTQQSRLVERRNTSGSFSMISGLKPRQLVSDKLEIERPISPQIEPKVQTVAGTDYVATDLILPSFTEYSVLTAKNFEFSSSMVGGKLEMNYLDIDLPSNIDPDEQFGNIYYTASIIEVVNTGSIKVYPPFERALTYRTTDGGTGLFSCNKFFNQTNFTCSYYEYNTVSQSATTQSFVTVDIGGIEPEFGNVSEIKMSYKPTNAFGEFRPLGSFPVTKTNVFTDPSAIMFDNRLGLIEKPIGNFRNVLIEGRDGLTDFQQYWDITPNGNAQMDKSGLMDSVLVSGSSEFYIAPKSAYQISASADTTYEVSFDTRANSGGKIDLYITSSTTIEKIGVTDRTTITTSRFSDIGTYLGSVDRSGNHTFYFKTPEPSRIRPLLLIPTGSWNIANLEISPIHSEGFSGNQTRLQIPLDNVEAKTELLLKVEYVGEDGQPSATVSTLSGVVFEGGRKEIIYPSQSLLSAGRGYDFSHIQTNSYKFNNIIDPITIGYPVFFTDRLVEYTGSDYTVGCTFQVITSVFGITGSAQSPSDTYQWASTIQGRAFVNRNKNSGQPFLYNTVIRSGSNVDQLGTFGNGAPTITNLDSWYKITDVTVRDGYLSVEYRLNSTSSFLWDGHFVSKVEVQKYEYRH